MPRCSLMNMGNPLFYFKIEVLVMINIQWKKFERKSIVSFISEESPYNFNGTFVNAQNSVTEPF